MIPDHLIECAARAVHEKHGQHIAPRYMDTPTWYRDGLEAQTATALEAAAAGIWDEGFDAGEFYEHNYGNESGTDYPDNPYSHKDGK